MFKKNLITRTLRNAALVGLVGSLAYPVLAQETPVDEESVENTLTALKEAEVNESIMIDASHGNSQKKFKQQIPVIESICQQITNGDKNIKGVMIESHLNEGNQKISENMKYGQSITDACMGWEDTVMCLQKLNDAIVTKRGK